MVKPFEPDVLRAAKLSRIPGVTIDEACKRFRVAKSAVQRARKTGGPATALSLAELALAALTKNGTHTSGTLDGLEHVAGWLDYVNHDGSTVEDVKRLLASLGDVLTIDGDRWRLHAAWP